MPTPTIVITGASSGMGAATAKRFAQAGYRLFLIARRKENLESLVREIGAKSASIFVLDITSQSDVEKTFLQIEKETGGIDILVNNAGLSSGREPAGKATLSDWKACVAVNIDGLLHCTHSVLPGMLKRNKGHIVNLGSVGGTYPYPGASVYCGTKAFVHQFSLGLRADLLGTEVRVTCIEPGLVGGTEFSLVRLHGDQAKVKELFDRTKPLHAEDIAEVIFLCTSLSPHININSIEVMPVSQAFAPLAVHKY
jgi:3-hydroxy acid dehydrogenase/malonic semialdehyde reductase